MDKESNSADIIRLELIVDDPGVVKYLINFDEPDRNQKALEALRVGVIAIQSASPSLDTKIVEEKFRNVEESINTCLDNFKTELSQKLEDNFKPESGRVPRSLDGFFGAGGTVSQVFEQYFSPERGKVSILLEKQIGPSSTFAKSIDPSQKESVICRIEDSVTNNLAQKTNEIVKQFSLDIPDSALTKLKSCIFTEIGKLKEDNNKFFGEIKTALGIEIGKQEESEKGTQKGRDFEEKLYERIAVIARELGDSSENVRAIVGLIPRAKTGDYILNLGETSGAPGFKIVVEAKKEQKYKIKDAIEELKEAKKNRGAFSGIIAFEKNCAPLEIGDFLKIGEDFLVTIDEENLYYGNPLVFFEAAYKISRVLIITAERKEKAEELDIDRIESEIDYIVEMTKRFAEMITKAKTINSNSKIIEQIAEDMKENMATRLQTVLGLIRRNKLLENQ